MSAAVVGGTCGVGFAVATSGISLVGTVYCVRQFHILYQQAKLLEEALIEKEIPLPEVRLKDVIIGILIGAGAYAAGLGVAHGLDHLANPVMEHLHTTMNNLVDYHFQAAANIASNVPIGPPTELTQHLTTPILDHLHRTAFEFTSVVEHPASALSGFFGQHGQQAGLGIAHLAIDSAQTPSDVGVSAATANVAGQIAAVQLVPLTGNIGASLAVSHNGEAWASKKDRSTSKSSEKVKI